jgi:hypothetical protein
MKYIIRIKVKDKIAKLTIEANKAYNNLGKRLKPKLEKKALKKFKQIMNTLKGNKS